MTPWADALPAGLMDAFRAVALEATAHVEQHGGPVKVEVTFFRDDKTSPVRVTVRLIQKEWKLDA